MLRARHFALSAGAPAVPACAASSVLTAPSASFALGRRAACSLAIASGVLYYLGFPGVGLWPCSLVALAPLVIALEGQSPRRSFLVGALAGLVANLLGFYWIYGTIKHFGELPGPVAALVVALLCTYQAGRNGSLAWLYGRARERGWPAWPAFLASLTASELVYPLIFPYYAAASVHQVPALTQLAELGGPNAVGLVLAAPSLSIAEIVLRSAQRVPIRWLRVALGASLPLGAALFGVVRIHQVDARVAASQPVHVGLVQRNLPAVASTSWHRRRSLEADLRMTDDLRERGADFVVWSEGGVDGVSNGRFKSAIPQILGKRLGVPALIGAVLVDDKEHGRWEFNTALALDAGGQVLGRYDKHHLFPFGESIPFGEIFPALYEWLPNASRMIPGAADEPLALAGHPITALICYEDILPSFVREKIARSDSDMLVNLTNDAWFGDTTEPWIHLALAQMRAVEHRRYLVRATNSGLSAIVDPVGRVVAEGHTFREETVDAVAHWMTGVRTGYEVWGDVPWWICTAAIGFMAFFHQRGVRERARSFEDSARARKSMR
jgi:apolipoprotein N-acyltransferase